MKNNLMRIYYFIKEAQELLVSRHAILRRSSQDFCSHKMVARYDTRGTLLNDSVID
jgi:hypothetical protein